MRACCCLVLVACQFQLNAGGSDAPVGDVLHLDVSSCVQGTVSCGDATTMVTCNNNSLVPTPCPWGCLTNGGVHCGMFTPSGGGVSPGDLDPNTMLGNVTIGGSLDGNNGSISVPGRNPVTTIDHGIGYQIEGTVAVFTAASFTINAITVGGSHPIAFVSDGPIVVTGVIDATPQCGGTVASAGGFGGGAKQGGNGNGSGGGSGGNNGNVGGGGGGYGGTGGQGSGANTVSGGSPYGDDKISTLVGGSGGGGGQGGGMSGAGGGGGGAIQIVSNTSIAIATSGGINAGGCGGTNGGGGGDGGGGGGAGGTILLEAPTISIDGALAVNGGGGGGGASGNNTQASAGRLSRSPASGGSGGANGGNGAAGATLDGSQGGNTGSKAGAGGGAVGRIRFDTRTGTVTLGGSVVLSPALDDMPATTCTQGTPLVQ